jgi:hypothetical protein
MTILLCRAEHIPHHESLLVVFRQEHSLFILVNFHQQAIHQLQFGLVD